MKPDTKIPSAILWMLVWTVCTASLGFAVTAQEGPTEVRAFDLQSILAPRSFDQALPIGFFPLQAPGFTAMWSGNWNDGTSISLSEEQAEPWLEVDSIVEIVSNAVYRATDSDDLSMYVQGSTMIVRGESPQLEVVRETLEMLERFAMRRVTVRAFVLDAGGTELATGILDRTSCETMVAGRGGARVSSTYEGNAGPAGRLILGDVREHAYVWDYDVEVAQNASIAAPRIGVLRSGRQVAVRVDPLQNDRIGLTVGIESVEPVMPFRRVVTRAAGVGEVELPEVSTHRVGMQMTVPNGGGILTELGADGVYMLVTATIETRPAATSRLAWFPLGFLVGGHADFVFRTKAPSDSAHRVGAGFAPEGGFVEEDEPSEYLSVDSIVDILIENVTRGVDDNTETVNVFADDQLLVGATRERHGQVAQFLSGLEALRDRNVSMHFELFEASDTVVEALHRRRASGGDAGWTLAPDAASELRRSFGDALGRATVTTLHGTGAAVFAGGERAVLRDYDVEIAQEASIADPNIDYYYDGLVLNARPVVHQSGDRMTLRIDGEIAMFELRGAGESFGAERIGGFDLPALSRIPVAGSIALKPGETRVLLLQAEGEGAFVLLVRGDLGSRR